MSENKKTYVLSSLCQKGGVGKTLTSANLAYVLSKMGHSVLAIDSDSQGTLSSLCNVLPKEYTPDFELFGLQDVYEYFIECEENHKNPQFEIIQKAIIRPKYRKINTRKKGGFEEHEFGFDLLPCDIGLANYEQILPRYGANSGLLLYRIIEFIKKHKHYDFVILDCPPSISNCVLQVLNASQAVICPINMEISTLRGARNLVHIVGEAQEQLWAQGILHYGVLGLVKNEYVERYRIQQDFESIVNDFFPIRPFKTAIPKKTSCDVAHRLGLMYAQYDKQVYEVFEKLAKEVIKRLEECEQLKEPVIIKELGSQASKELWVNKTKPKGKKNKKGKKKLLKKKKK